MQKRIDWIDIAKGIGIISVILGHLRTPLYISEMIFSFHMPLFFVISGYFYKERKLKNFIFLKYKSLILPYIYLFSYNFFVRNFEYRKKSIF